MTEIILEGYLTKEELDRCPGEVKSGKLAAYRRCYHVDIAAENWQEQMLSALRSVLAKNVRLFRVKIQLLGFSNDNADFIEQSLERLG